METLDDEEAMLVLPEICVRLSAHIVDVAVRQVAMAECA